MVKNRPAPPRAHGAAALLPALRARIARHEMTPGAKLLENELSREFGLSRAKVRDAFGALAQRGLIQRIPNRGAIVAKLDLSQVFEIYDVREMLEGLCVRLAVKPALLNKTLARALNMLSHRVRFGYPLAGVVIGGCDPHVRTGRREGEDRLSQSLAGNPPGNEFMTMEIIVAALMVIVALVFVGIAMHAARNPKGRD